MRVYLRDGSPQTILRAATLRQNLQIKLSTSPVTVHWHRANQPQRRSCNARRLAGWPLCCQFLTLNFLVTMVDTLNTETHSSKERAEFSFEKSDVKRICYCKQRMKSKVSLSSDCVKTKLWKPCTSFAWHLHSWCGLVWCRTLRDKSLVWLDSGIKRHGASGNRTPDVPLSRRTPFPLS